MKDIRIKSLKVNNIKITENNIKNTIARYNMDWLLDCEFDNAVLEIVNNTMIWKNGTFYHGDWIFGIFENGEFFGNFLSGVFKSDKFKGKKIDGVFALSIGYDS